MSTARGIVTTHHGFITLETAAGRGTTFSVYLPAIDSTEAATGGGATPLPPKGCGALVLVVDDESTIREVARLAFTRHGYRVIMAGDGAEALELFNARRFEISLVLTDLDMPKLHGNALADAIRHLNPAVKILAMSGGAAADRPVVVSAFSDAFLSKPFTVGALLHAAHGLLEPAAAGSPDSPSPSQS